MNVATMIGALAYKMVSQNPAIPTAKKAAASRAMSALAKLMGGGFTSSGLFRTIKYVDAVNDAYKAVVWVYACVRTISDACASPTWKAFEVGKSGTLKPLPGHEAEVLIQNPNPFTSGADLIRDWAIDLQLAGLSYWEVVFVKGVPYRLFRIRPDHMHAVADARTQVSKYVFSPGGTTTDVDFAPEEIVRFRYVDPLDPFDAIAPVEAARRVIQTQNAAEVWNKAVFDNMAIPGGLLKIPAEVLDGETRQQVKEELMESYTRSNVGHPMVLWGGMEWSPMALDHTSLDFSKQSEENKIAVCAAMRVSPILVGANPDPTFSNYKVARLAFWEDFVIPHLDWIQSTLNQRITAFYSNRDGKQIQLRYDLSNIPAMRDSFIASVDTAQKLSMIGYTRNEINTRLQLGFQNVAWGDAWWAPSMVQPVTEESYGELLEYGKPAAQLPAPEPQEDPAADDDPADDEVPTLDDDEEDADSSIKGKKRNARRKPKKPTLY